MFVNRTRPPERSVYSGQDALRGPPRGLQDSSKRPPEASWTLYTRKMALETRFYTPLGLQMDPSRLQKSSKTIEKSMKISVFAELTVFCARRFLSSIWEPFGPPLGSFWASRKPLRRSKRAPGGVQERPKMLPGAPHRPLEAPP